MTLGCAVKALTPQDHEKIRTREAVKALTPQDHEKIRTREAVKALTPRAMLKGGGGGGGVCMGGRAGRGARMGPWERGVRSRRRLLSCPPAFEVLGEHGKARPAY